VLVAAVLRPEKREDGQLEMIRLTLEQLLDTRVLPVREAELTVEWLFRDGAQDASLAASPDGPPPRSGGLAGQSGRRLSHGDAPAASTVTKP
jgi:hypothetical protein